VCVCPQMEIVIAKKWCILWGVQKWAIAKLKDISRFLHFFWSCCRFSFKRYIRWSQHTRIHGLTHTHTCAYGTVFPSHETSTPQVPQNEKDEAKGPEPMIKSMFQAGDTLVSFASLYRCCCCHRQCYFCCFLLVRRPSSFVCRRMPWYMCVSQSVAGRMWVCVRAPGYADTQIPTQMKPPNPGEFNARPGRRTKLCLHFPFGGVWRLVFGEDPSLPLFLPNVFRSLSCRGKLCRLLIYYENATFIWLGICPVSIVCRRIRQLVKRTKVCVLRGASVCVCVLVCDTKDN